MNFPQAFRTGVERKNGARIDQTTLMTWEDKAKQERYIRHSRVDFRQTCFSVPQPARGWLEEADHLYHDVTLPPHHQYLAFYLWLKHEFNTERGGSFWKNTAPWSGHRASRRA